MCLQNQTGVIDMGKICNMDCFNCKFPDCINDTVYPESARYCNWSEERKKRDNARCAKRYREAVSKGLCGRCHKKPQYQGKLCYECWLKRKRYDASKATHKREYRREHGLCYFCDTPAVPGKKTCEKHLRIFQEKMAYAAQFNDLKKHKWYADERLRYAEYCTKQKGNENQKLQEA